MFGKKAAGAGSAKPRKPRDVLTGEIDQLTPGQELLFRLPEMYGPEIIIVEVKKDYQGKGPRFSVIGARPVDGKPGPVRNTIFQLSKAKAIADWLILRSAQKYT